MGRFLLFWLLVTAPALASPEAEKVVATPIFEVHLGTALAPMVDSKFLPRVKFVRDELLVEKGFLLGGLRFVPDSTLAPGEYRILAGGNSLGQGTIEPDRIMVVSSEKNLAHFAGNLTQEPTYGVSAKWVPVAERSKAEALGCIVFEDVSVWGTQMSQLARRYAAEFYTPDHLKAGLAELKLSEPALADRVGSQPEVSQRMLGVVRNLLDEGVPVRDLATIAEVVVNSPRLRQDADSLSEGARLRLAGAIFKEVSVEGQVSGLQAGPRLDKALSGLGRYGAQGLVISENPAVQSEIMSVVKTAVASFGEKGLTPVLVTSSEARLILRRLTRKDFHSLVVLSRRELSSSFPFQSLGTVELK